MAKVINKSTKVLACLLAFLLLACLPFFLNDMQTQYLKYRLRASILEHAKISPYRADFTESLDMLEALQKKGHSDHVVSVLISCLESEDDNQQCTAFHLLPLIDKHYTKAAIPVLQKLADDEKAEEECRISAEGMLLDLQDE